MALWRSKMTFESINECNVIQIVNSIDALLLPDDAHTSTIDDGHHCAFYSNCDLQCEQINKRIAFVNERSIKAILASPTFENDSRSEVEKRVEIDTEGWGFKGYAVALTPQHVLRFTGWEKVSE
jgi:hypothetical protein